MRRFACYPLLVALAMTTSLSAGLAAEACSEQPTPINVLKEITEFQGGQSLPIISSNRIAPAEATIDVIVQKPFESSPPQGKPPLYYRAIVQSDQSAAPQADAVALLIGTSVTAKAISKEDRLVKDGVVPTDSTVVTLDIPSSVGTAWQMGYIYVFGCRSPTDSPAFVSKFPIRISDRTYSQIAIWAMIVALYILAAIAAGVTDKKNLRFLRYLDPVVLTAGANGKGSVSKLQVLFFTIIVFGLLGYVVLRAGILSNLSLTVLGLLGIAGVGAAASKATDVTKNRLDFDNWAWLIRKEWLPPGGLAAENTAKWRDIVTSDGEFDIYRFQSFIFSVVVGGALLATGFTGLATFNIPEALLGILGLSQIVFIGGKLASPPSCSDLNTAIKGLKDAEMDFIMTAAKTPDPAPLAGANPLDEPQDLEAAIRRAGRDKYSAYMSRVKEVKIMFESVTGRSVTPTKLAPAFKLS